MNVNEPVKERIPLYIMIDQDLDRLNYSVYCLEQLMGWITNGSDKIPEEVRRADQSTSDCIPAMLLRCMPERISSITKRIDDLCINLRGVFE